MPANNQKLGERWSTDSHTTIRRNQPCRTLMDSWHPEPWTNTFLLFFHPVCGTLLEQPKQANTLFHAAWKVNSAQWHKGPTCLCPDSHPGPLDVPPSRPGACLRPLWWLFLQPLCSAPVPSVLSDVCFNASIRPSPPSNTPTPLTNSCLSPPLCHLRKLYLLWQTGRATAKTCRAAAGRSTPGPSSSVTRERPAGGHTPSGQPHQVTHLKAVSSSLSASTCQAIHVTPGFSGRPVEALPNLHRSSTSSSAQSCFHPLLFTVLIPSPHLVPQPPNQHLLQENPTLKHLPASHHFSIILLRAESLFQCVPKA